MAITITQITSQETIEDAIASFMESANNLTTRFAGFDFTRTRPYQTLMPTSTKRAGKPWQVQTISGIATTQYKQTIKMMVDLDVFTDTYDSKQKAIRLNPQHYSDMILNAMHIPEARTDLDAINLKLLSARQMIATANVKIDTDKWIKQGTTELMFSYVATFQKVDDDTITTIDLPTINITE